LRVSRAIGGKIYTKKRISFALEPRARYLNACGYDHVELERNPTPTASVRSTVTIGIFIKFCDKGIAAAAPSIPREKEGPFPVGG
jgi:hypothetical protein